MNNFREEVTNQINNFTRQQAETFACICIMRVLPFLNPWINTLHYKMQNETAANESSSLTYSALQKHLFSIFWSIDVTLAYSDRAYRTSYECEVAYAARGDTDIAANAIKNDDRSAAYVARATSRAMENTNLYLYGPHGDYADVAVYACTVIEKYDQRLIKAFEDIVFKDINAIKQRNVNKLYEDINVFD